MQYSGRSQHAHLGRFTSQRRAAASPCARPSAERERALLRRVAHGSLPQLAEDALQKFTARGMRRTFNDLSRTAKVESLVTKSISGHLTDRMKDHY